MKKTLIFILLLAGIGAQAQTVNEATVRSQISTLLTTNANKAITAATHRQLMNLMVEYINRKTIDSTQAVTITTTLNTKPTLYNFNTYALALAGMSGVTGRHIVYVVADEENNGGAEGWYMWNGTVLKEILVL